MRKLLNLIERKDQGTLDAKNKVENTSPNLSQNISKKSPEKESRLFLSGLFSTKKPSDNEQLPFWRTMFGPNRNLSDSTIAYSWVYLGFLIMYMGISLITGTSYAYYVSDEDIEEFKRTEGEAMMAMTVGSAVDQGSEGVGNVQGEGNNVSMTDGTGIVQQQASSSLDADNTEDRFGETSGHFLMQVRKDGVENTPQMEWSNQWQESPAQHYPIYYVQVSRDKNKN